MPAGGTTRTSGSTTPRCACSRSTGFEQVSVGQIVAGAGVTGPTFYAHYQSKEHLVMQLPTAEELTALLSTQPADLPVGERIRRAVPVWFASWTRSTARPSAVEVIATTPSDAGRRVRAHHRRDGHRRDWRAASGTTTHRRIYDTALQLFQEHGFEQVSVGQIADGAGRLGADVLRALPVQGTHRHAAAVGGRLRGTARRPAGRTRRWPTGSGVPSRCGCRQWTPEFREDALARWRIVAATPSLRTRAAEFERATGGVVADALPDEPARRCGRPTRSS